MYGEPDIVLSFIRYAYWVMSVEADVCNYCKFVFDMARFTYTSINYTRGTSLRSEVPLVFVCSKPSTRVDGYNAPLKIGGQNLEESRLAVAPSQRRFALARIIVCCGASIVAHFARKVRATNT